MTVCIVAIASDGRAQCVVTTSDQLVGGDMGSSESTVKLEMFWEDWSVLYAAADVGQASIVIGAAREFFCANPDTKNTVSNVRSAFKKVCRERLAEVAGDRILSPFGLDMASFLKTGREVLTDQTFNALADDIRRVSLGCEFLVYGFDSSQRAHIFKVVEYAGTGPEDVDCGKPGFAAIGVGRSPAEVILYALDQNIDVKWQETIYNVCAAKFMSERVSGVGKNTFLYVKKPGTNAFSRPPNLVKNIRAWWDKEGAPRIPKGVMEEIEKARIIFFP